ncbi:MerR family transcriptional regulator [Sporolactobacillus laevolacticus]|uniref:MerR family transcriptional regulator n=1 Tax=Sporolactobacillus laevolacticus TaxID=33018 RepID=UPI0025B5AC68|nr:MerR family transcriptional regulator [Sporolactobacillus laevolacticus]MDN3955928.1 MerR family transcriptional regulator [Sporolactobacillus laevolacticus]
MNIQETSRKYSVSANTLRYWERVGAIPRVNRNQNGYRDYDSEDEEWVSFAKCMRDSGITIERLVEYIDLFRQGDSTIPSRKALLQEQLDEINKKIDEMAEIQRTLKSKVENYEDQMLSYEGKLKGQDSVTNK